MDDMTRKGLIPMFPVNDPLGAFALEDCEKSGKRRGIFAKYS